jgi:hypothetical protein
MREDSKATKKLAARMDPKAATRRPSGAINLAATAAPGMKPIPQSPLVKRLSSRYKG